MWRIFKKMLFKCSPLYAIFESPEGVPVNWRPGAWMVGVHGSLGVLTEYDDTKRDCFPLSFKWNSHCTLQTRHNRDLFLTQLLCRRIPGGYFHSLERLCIFSLLANFMPLKQRLHFVLRISDGKQYCLWGVRENLSGEQDILLSCCGLCGSLCAKGWPGLLLLWLLLQG